MSINKAKERIKNKVRGDDNVLKKLDGSQDELRTGRYSKGSFKKPNQEQEGGDNGLDNGEDQSVD